METKEYYARKVAVVVGIVVALAFVGSTGILFKSYSTQKVSERVVDPKDAAYTIAGESVQLIRGTAEMETTPGSASKTITRYFGNELLTDLDGDGSEDDVAFIVTQEHGGSGTFYYAVAAIKTSDGYVGSDGYLLGDRIAPQTTNVSPNPRHKYVVVFNYADRPRNAPMTEQPSVGKSAYLKIVPESMQWAIVEPDFPGEAR